MADTLAVSVTTVAGNELLSCAVDESALVSELVGLAAQQAGVGPEWVQLLCEGTVLDPAWALRDVGLTEGVPLTMIMSTRPRWASLTGRLLCVTLAGSDQANGVYYPIEAMPPGAGPQIEPMAWRHRDVDWLHVFRQDELWWIGHFADCMHDFYCTSHGSGEAPPCGQHQQGWEILNEEPHQLGVFPLPRVDWMDEEPAPPRVFDSGDPGRVVRLTTGANRDAELRQMVLNAVHMGLECPDWLEVFGRPVVRPDEHLEQLQALFQEWNVSGTGLMSLDEVISSLAILGVPEGVAEAVFQAADADQDGKLNRTEFEDWVFRPLDLDEVDELLEIHNQGG